MAQESRLAPKHLHQVQHSVLCLLKCTEARTSAQLCSMPRWQRHLKALNSGATCPPSIAQFTSNTQHLGSKPSTATESSLSCLALLLIKVWVNKVTNYHQDCHEHMYNNTFQRKLAPQAHKTAALIEQWTQPHVINPAGRGFACFCQTHPDNSTPCLEKLPQTQCSHCSQQLWMRCWLWGLLTDEKATVFIPISICPKWTCTLIIKPEN